MKQMTKLFTVLTLTLVVSGCLKTRSEVAEVEEKKQAQISVEQQRKADDEVRVQDLEVSFRQLNGRMEAIEHRLNMDLEKRQQNSEAEAMTQKQIVDQLKIFDESLKRMEERLSNIETQPRGAVVGAAPGSKPSDGNAQPSSYAEGEKSFQQKDWRSAILSFQKYRDENPKGKLLSDATYKIGVSFQELGKKEEAKVFYDEVVEKYPKSPSARKAQYRLKNLNLKNAN